VDGSAVVIGASMAGLVTARVLSRRYASVTVLDRDTLPESHTPRRGVPQGAQPHILLVSGLRDLSALFNGLEEELLGSGATKFDPGMSLATYRYGRRWPAAPTGLALVSMSRPHLEGIIRARVAREPGVTIRDQITVTALDGADGRVTGVRLDTGESIPADLVVDCSGRGGRSDRWLTDLGLPAPERVEIKVGVAYTTRLYRRAPGDLPGWQAVFTLPTAPRENLTGLALPIEDDRWLISIGGWHVDSPPADAESFEAIARSLPDPLVGDLLTHVEPLTELVTHRFPSSRWRRFAELDVLPAGYAAVGDAVCSFNPIYGQGMTCAAKEAVALGAALDRHGAATAEMAREYYRAADQIVATPWQFAVGGDFAYPQTTGPRPRDIKMRNWYSRRIALASQVAPDINAAFVGVQHLVTPPSVLFKPAMIARVLRMARKRGPD
jgi:2-polyprenyl-6-methoxyphenol hydroxylase-like FAD-dependent oxidoreductase